MSGLKIFNWLLTKNRLKNSVKIKKTFICQFGFDIWTGNANDYLIDLQKQIFVFLVKIKTQMYKTFLVSMMFTSAAKDYKRHGRKSYHKNVINQNLDAIIIRNLKLINCWCKKLIIYFCYFYTLKNLSFSFLSLSTNAQTWALRRKVFK